MTTDVEDRESLLAPEMLARLSRLALLCRRAQTARRRGPRSRRRVGAGATKLDTRPYAIGDDPRRIAWTAYARLERLLVYEMEDEQPLRVALVVDTSESMRAGTPSKLRAASRIAAGLAAISLSDEDRVAVVGVSDAVRSTLPRVSGRRGLSHVLRTLEGLSTDGATQLDAAVASVEGVLGGRGLVVVLSDFFDPRGALEGARAMRARGHALALVEVLDPSEIDPDDLSGCTVEDEETGELVDLPFGFPDAYRRALAEHRAEVDRVAGELEAPILRTTTRDDLEAVVLRAIETRVLHRGGTR